MIFLRLFWEFFKTGLFAVLALAVFTKLSPVIFVVAAALAGVAVKAWGAKK